MCAGSDIDNEPLGYQVVAQPYAGAVAIAGGSFTFDPESYFHYLQVGESEEITFTYIAIDPCGASSEPRTVTLTIHGVNDQPSLLPQAFAIWENSPAATPVGTLDAADPADDNGATSSATVTIQVNPVNDAPTAANDTYAIDEDTHLVVAAAGLLANDADVDNDPLTAILVAGPAHGTLILNANGSFTYVPDPNYYGDDSFTYKAIDGAAESNEAIVYLTVAPVNDAPVAMGESFSVPHAGGHWGNVFTNDFDIDGDPLSAELISYPEHGYLWFNNGTGEFYFGPDAWYAGPDAFSYRLWDGAAPSDIVTVSIEITNQLPFAEAASGATDEDTAVTLDLSASDPDGDPVPVAVVTGPTIGQVTIDGASLAFDPAQEFDYLSEGEDVTVTFTVKAIDITGAESAPALITLTVHGRYELAELDSFYRSRVSLADDDYVAALDDARAERALAWEAINDWLAFVAPDLEALYVDAMALAHESYLEAWDAAWGLRQDALELALADKELREAEAWDWWDDAWTQADLAYADAVAAAEQDYADDLALADADYDSVVAPLQAALAAAQAALDADPENPDLQSAVDAADAALAVAAADALVAWQAAHALADADKESALTQADADWLEDVEWAAGAYDTALQESDALEKEKVSGTFYIDTPTDLW